MMGSDSLAPLFTWRSAVASKDGPAGVTRHVLLTLSLHMNERGGSCFPSVDTLVEETGLSRPTVVKHLDAAVEAGWLLRGKRGQSGQGWRRNEYVAALPASVSAEEGGKADLPREPLGGGRNIPTREGEGGKAGEPRSAVEGEGGKPRSEKVVKEVNSSTSVSSSGFYNDSAHATEIETEIRAQAIARMWQFVEAKIAGHSEPSQRKARAKVEGLIDGTNVTAWQDETGSRVPWTERDRLFALAWNEGVASDRHIENALRFTIIPQQLHPFEVKRKAEAVAPNSEAARVRSETPGASRSMTAGPSGFATPAELLNQSVLNFEREKAKREQKEDAA